MKLLAVDTSSLAATVALWEDNFLRGEYYLNTKLTHSQTIMEMVSSLLAQSQTEISDIDALACAVGPGSFTGLRIGIAAIKGMAYGINKPCIPVSTLEGLAHNLNGFEGYICPVMDARCNQVYTSLFKFENGGIVRLWEDMAITIDELKVKLLEYSHKKIYFVGDGTQICMDRLKGELQNIVASPPALMFSRASSIGAVAEKMFKENQMINANELLPSYLRLPQAERELKKKNADKI
ncbi:MAG: tRNA (adenosine(37)-N6)-threonylcarbamoyltransferase complex dimerization subunit type 1 TsaB [Oscillospiraceae bacterium]